MPIKLTNLILEFIDTYEWYHGSASGDLRGGKTGLHLGTFKAAKEALEATIGIPVEGEWDGTRKYGETLLCGKTTLKSRNIFPTGFNTDIPIDDFYPTIQLIRRWSSFITLDMKPSIKKYKIVCKMTNTPNTAYSDAKANGMMKALIRKGVNVRRGFYYKNDSEDYGSISVVVKDGSCLKEI